MTLHRSRSRVLQTATAVGDGLDDEDQELLELAGQGSAHSIPMHFAGAPDGLQDEDVSLLDRRTVRKIDFILLPFLSLLFLLNSLDKSNIGNAETANFTRDAGLAPEDLNTAVALFFVFFVALQPLGAALGRRYGMALWVPSCMLLWGVCTALHVWVRSRWQLIILRIIIGILEAGFYPTTVSYLSLFYTRFEFGRRLSIFYGQNAVAGALGGILSYGVFSRFPGGDKAPSSWKSWQVLFLIEGSTTMVVALVGYLWLPHSPGTAWFLKAEERAWADTRIQRDRSMGNRIVSSKSLDASGGDVDGMADSSLSFGSDQEAHRLLMSESSLPPKRAADLTSDSGISTRDIISAFTDWKIYYLLTVNILSSIPTTAFAIFLPLIIKPLSDTPAHANILTAPPFLIGASILYLFASWSDRHRFRIVPILYSLGLLLTGLSAVVLLPQDQPALRYLALCLLLAGTFVASPLTVAWLADNVPSPGKRAVVLGINGWGNFAGVLAAVLFKPQFAPGYVFPFAVTFLGVLLAFAGYAGFRLLLMRENERRRKIVAEWDEDEVEREREFGDGPLGRAKARAGRSGILAVVGKSAFLTTFTRWIDDAGGTGGRSGDEKMTFLYGL